MSFSLVKLANGLFLHTDHATKFSTLFNSDGTVHGPHNMNWQEKTEIALEIKDMQSPVSHYKLEIGKSHYYEGDFYILTSSDGKKSGYFSLQGKHVGGSQPTDACTRIMQHCARTKTMTFKTNKAMFV